MPGANRHLCPASPGPSPIAATRRRSCSSSRATDGVTWVRCSTPGALRDVRAQRGFTDVGDLQRAHRQWVDEALRRKAGKRDERWSEAIAVGRQAYDEGGKRELGMKARHRDIDDAHGAYALR